MPQSRSPYGVLVATVVVVLLLLFVYSVAQVLLLLFVAVLFALYLGAATEYFQRRLRVPRWVGLPMALLLSLLIITAVGLLIIPPVMEQTQELISALPGLLTQWEDRLFDLVSRYPLLQHVLPPRVTTGTYFDSVLGRIGTYFAGLFPYVFSGIRLLIDVVSVLVMGIYLALQPALYLEGLIALVPAMHRSFARDILTELGTTLRGWIVGQILAMIFLGVLTWIGLMVLAVPYALAFGVFTGVAVVVPFFGTLISTILPALFVLASRGLVAFLLVILLGVVVHLAEANIVHPMIMARKVHLPPVLSILSVLVMSELLGIIGLLVAVPTLATLVVLVRRIYVQRIAEGKGFRRNRRGPSDAPLPEPERRSRAERAPG